MSSNVTANYSHDYVTSDSRIGNNEKRTLWVVFLTFITMIVEIAFGHWTGSMALLADGWHMGSHVGALGISVIAYRLAKSSKMNSKFTFGAGKFIPLGGYTSAIMLGMVALLMCVESLNRFVSPQSIDFSTAIFVSVVGLVVNVASALLLWDSHDHQHDEHTAKDHVHDHNHKSALVHVIADALTSVMAIVALLLGKHFGWVWADPLIGVAGGVVILRWAYTLVRKTSWELLDGRSKLFSEDDIRNLFANDDG
ncbi:MAG: CDF family Co(II)/Ni(II) efflux transporter DmeF, partial [Bdellovibrionales bacterium]|nr:CDF family Co(II)/Ni(II) efflux transporter DmeF [Bdellovibrionales bacterium]